MRRTRPGRSDAGMIPTRRAALAQSGTRFSDKIMAKHDSDRSDAPHLPRSAPIDAYGNGGFAFAGMSHRGSLLCLPNGIWAWPVTRLSEIDEISLARIL